jgi:endonuclease/exonuclease/phosphatase (EEP) superfamily protein YafD
MFRRGLAVVLGLALVLLTVAFALRWVDVATREVAAGQAVVPITGAGVVGVTLLALVCGLRRLALVGAVPSAVAVGLAVASFGLTATPSSDGAETVTLLSSNLEFGAGNADDIVKGVRDHHADVVVLVELTPQAVTRLKAAGLDQELPYVVGHPEAGTTGAAIQRPGGAFRVKAVHTRQPIVSARGWAQDLDRLHTWQLAQPTDQPLFMAGDFNASQSHPPFRSMIEGLTDAHRATGGGWVRTWPQGRRIPPFVQLDHVLGRGVTAVDAGVTPVRGSDHAAVWATVTLELP